VVLTKIPPSNRDRRIDGFTLIETIIVIVIVGVISVICAVFIKTGFDSYFNSVRRAEIVEVADIAVQRLAREVRLAVPNSLRVVDSSGNVGSCVTGTCFIEFVPTKSGGKYRNNGDGSTAGNFMCDGATVGATSTTFDVFGAPVYVPGDYVVVDNDANLPAGDDVYAASGNRATITSAANNSPISISSAFGDPTVICGYANNRFQIVDQSTQAVTYSCPITSSTGSIKRYMNYGFNQSQQQPSGGSMVTSLVAGNASYSATCPNVSYMPNVQQRNGLLYFSVTVTDTSGEKVTVFRQIHVDNSP